MRAMSRAVENCGAGNPWLLTKYELRAPSDQAARFMLSTKADSLPLWSRAKAAQASLLLLTMRDWSSSRRE